LARKPADRSDETERNSMAGRVRRYARVGGAVGGLAARVAGARYLGTGLDRGRHAAELTAALGGLKGPLMKVAQILSTIPDVLPREYAAALAQLQADAPAIGRHFVRRRMASELGPDWATRFGTFDLDAVAAASLGQVHRAMSTDRRELACKLQYPDMQSAVEADLRQLRLIFSIYERYDRTISTQQIHAEISARLREELDYAREAKHMALYRHLLAGENGVHVPEGLPELSTGRLLTMTWLDGERMMPFIAAHRDDVEMRNRVAYNMFRAWYVPFYNYGIIHGDPHLGNYTVRTDGSVNLLDFGCIRVFPPGFVRGVIDLYRAIERDDEALAIDAYERWGFRNLNRETIRVLNRWAAFLYGPLLEDRERRIQENEGEIYGAEVAAGVHAELRKLGPVTPPREFVLMDRAAIGLGSVFMHLKAEINWYRIFHELIGDFDMAALERRQKKALADFGIETPE
jgi:predicted unusual protein kinase regulating ubiquinone biosynthesis (AarF/ABC1/UbiB family)